MKVSGDLLLKVGIGVAVAGLVYLAWRRTVGAAGELASAAGARISEAADAVIAGTNPNNRENWVNQAVTAAGSSVVSSDGPGRNADGSWTLGGALYDLTHTNWVNQAVTAAGSSVVGSDGPGRNADGSWTLGGAVFDLVNWGWDKTVSGPAPAKATPAGTVAGGMPVFLGWDPTQTFLGAP